MSTIFIPSFGIHAHSAGKVYGLDLKERQSKTKFSKIKIGRKNAVLMQGENQSMRI